MNAESRLMPRAGAYRYVVALAAVAAATLLRTILDATFGTETPLLFYHLAIAFTAYYGGFGPAMVATALSLVLGSLFFLEPRGELLPERTMDAVRMGLVCASGVLFGWAGEILRRRERLTEEALDHARRALAQVGHQERQLRDILDSMTCFSGLATPEGVVVQINRLALEVSGLSPQDVVGRRLGDVFWWSYDAGVSATIDAAVAKAAAGEAARLDVRSRVGEDRFIVIDLTLVPLFDEAGRVTHLVGTGLDVTERLAIEDELRRSEAKLRRFFESGIVATFVARPNGQVLEANDRYLALIGQTRDALAAGKVRWDEMTPPEYARLDHQGRAEVQARGACVPYEKEYVRPDGRRVPVLVAYARLDGDPSEANIGFALDLSEQVAARRELESAEERFRQLADSINEVFWLYDVAERRLVYANRAFDRLLGQTQEDAGTVVRSMLERVVATGEPVEREYRILRRDGSDVWVRNRTFPVLGAGGVTERVAGVTEDVTARRRAEEALRASETRFRTLAEAVPLVVWTADPDGLVDYCNDRWNELTGLESPMRDSWSDALHPDDRAAAAAGWQESVATAAPYEFEARLRARDGTYRWILTRATPLKDAQGRVVKWFGTATDVTDIRAVADELLRAKNEADAANRAKSQFLANISHEIRTPLNAIIGFSELLRDERVLPSPADRKQALDTVVRNGRALGQLIDDLLDLAKVEAGEFSIEPRPVALRALVDDVLQALAGQARGKRLALRVDVVPGTPEIVRTDPHRLRQILLNVVGNAIKFTAEGRVTLSVSWSTRPAPGTLAIRVEDTGSGIRAEQSARLFEPFQQGDASTTRRHGGTGLGLALARRLAERLGGTVSLEWSEVGRGSRFLVEIAAPRQEAVDRDKPRQEAAASGPPEPAPRRAADAEPSATAAIPRVLDGVRVLLADDAEDNQTLIRRILTSAGAQVQVAGDGEEALRLAEKASFDLVLMDIQMPRLDGYGATTELRRRGFRGPIVALTAHAMREDRERSRAAGCDDHITKPVNVRELVDKLAGFVAQPADAT